MLLCRRCSFKGFIKSSSIHICTLYALDDFLKAYIDITLLAQRWPILRALLLVFDG